MTTTSDFKSAIPLFERAISLDPNFAMAYAQLSTNHSNMGEAALAAENARKAYDLRQRVSKREKFAIEFSYEQFVTENLEAAGKVLEEWMQAYPRDDAPPYNLANVYAMLGEYEKILPLKQKSLRLNPDDPMGYWGLIGAYSALNRLDEAKATIEEAQSRHFDSPSIHTGLYVVAFLQHDTAGMEREAALLLSKPGMEPVTLYLESETAAYGGQMSRARELAVRAVDELKRTGNPEAASSFLAQASLREALVGNVPFAKRQAHDALALSGDKYIQAASAITLGLSGEPAKAARLADDLERRFPENTSIKFHYLPMIRGAIATKSGNARKAREAFEVGAPYELGVPNGMGFIRFYPVYLRGQAYLQTRQVDLAAAEFQKILDHFGLVGNEPIGALANLGLGRAYAIAGDSAKARTAYQDFLALWKDADPDVPVLKQASAEYEKLR